MISVLTIDCEEVENAYDVTNGQMADLNWLLYNKPLEYASLMLSGEMENYLKGPALHGIEDKLFAGVSCLRYTGFLLLLVHIFPACFRRTGIPPSVIVFDGGCALFL